MADAEGGDRPPPPPGPDADEVARYLIAVKIRALSKLIAQLGSSAAAGHVAVAVADTLDAAEDELISCRVWLDSLHVGDTSNLPSHEIEGPLLRAVVGVEHLIGVSASVNALLQAGTTLINVMKAPSRD